MAKRRPPARAAAAPPLAPLVAALALLMAPPCSADWKVAPSVTLRETSTDNVRLEADAAARSEFITELVPSLMLTNDAPRLKVDATVSAHLYRYSDSQVAGLNRSQRQLDAHARAKLIDELLFADASASIGQHAVSAFGPQLADNAYSGTNRTDVSTYRISPYLAHRFGAATRGELRYAHDSVKSGNAGFGDSAADTLSMQLDSDRPERTLGWGVQASQQRLASTRGGDATIALATANLRWRFAQSFSLTGKGGYDRYGFQANSGDTAGAHYALGFIWTPSPRTSLQASGGQRFYGPSYALNASHRSRSTVWNLAYQDTLTTPREQFLLPATLDTAGMLDRLFSANIADPAARRQAVDAFLRTSGLPASLAENVNYLSNRFLLQRQWQAATAYSSARTTSVLSLSATRREALSSQQIDSGLLSNSLGNLNDNTRQASATLSVNYRLSPRSGVLLLASTARTESLSTGLKTNPRQFAATLTHQLQPRLKAALDVRRNQGAALSSSARTYRENVVSASLSLAL